MCLCLFVCDVVFISVGLRCCFVCLYLLNCGIMFCVHICCLWYHVVCSCLLICDMLPVHICWSVILCSLFVSVGLGYYFVC